jgi:hypothetical protein
VRVRPEPECEEEPVDLLKRYRDALNHSVEKIIGEKATSLSKAHALLYRELKEAFHLPSRIAMDCYREALSIAKSWLSNPNKGTMPKAKTLRLWLTPSLSYRIEGNYVEVLGGYRLRIAGWDRRYDQYPSGEARLMYKEGKFFLMIFRRVPRPSKHAPKGVLAVDVNEKEIVFGNGMIEERRETAIGRALRYKKLAEKLQQKYSSARHNAWLRRSIFKRARHFHRKARNIIEDWAKKVSREIAELARRH